MLDYFNTFRYKFLIVIYNIELKGICKGEKTKGERETKRREKEKKKKRKEKERPRHPVIGLDADPKTYYCLIRGTFINICMVKSVSIIM